MESEGEKSGSQLITFSGTSTKTNRGTREEAEHISEAGREERKRGKGERLDKNVV